MRFHECPLGTAEFFRGAPLDATSQRGHQGALIAIAQASFGCYASSDAQGGFVSTASQREKQLLDAIEEFKKSHKQPRDEREFRVWLAATNEKYNRWLSSCERVSTL